MGKTPANATCSSIDWSEYGSRPIRRCLFIGYITKGFTIFKSDIHCGLAASVNIPFKVR